CARRVTTTSSVTSYCSIRRGTSSVSRELIILRHAKSDWSGDEHDVDRPLAPRGRRQAPEAGQWLDARAGAIDLALVSPARRTRSTWELVAPELDSPPPIRYDDRLYAAECR